MTVQHYDSAEKVNLHLIFAHTTITVVLWSYDWDSEASQAVGIYNHHRIPQSCDCHLHASQLACYNGEAGN